MENQNTTREAAITLARDRFMDALRTGALDPVEFIKGHDASRAKDNDLLRDTSSTPHMLVDRAEEQVGKAPDDRFTSATSAAAGRLVGFLVATQPQFEGAEL